MMPDQTRNQIQVFHLQLKDGRTFGGPVLEDTHSLIALNDLGVKASDILQSNCVVWVEGPSDRIYFKRWLELVAPNLIEGLHYSIMFYGGSLHSHLNLERERNVSDELVQVLRINQRAIVMIDSDRDNSKTGLSQAKQRIREECERSESICWITHGREVENYLCSRVIEAACEEYRGRPVKVAMGPYDRIEEVLSVALKKKSSRPIDKFEWARRFAPHLQEADMSSELRRKVEDVAAQIRDWNT